MIPKHEQVRIAALSAVAEAIHDAELDGANALEKLELAHRILATGEPDGSSSELGVMQVFAPWCPGSDMISEERWRQIVAEGWTAHGDDRHQQAQMGAAAESYLVMSQLQAIRGTPPSCFIPKAWPWSRAWWKPSEDPIRNLVKAGALIAAEIDRLLRKRERDAVEKGGAQ